jgi:dipeptidyl aminopeptidase/acylaminoacyl peptidase
MMKSNRWKAGRRWLAGTAAALLGPAAVAGAAEPPEVAPPPPLIPVEDFARAPQYLDMQLSPDGTCIAFRTYQNESSGLGFFSIDKMKAEEMMWGEKGFSVAGKNNAVFGYQWVSPNRVLATTALGWAGTNSDFSYFKYLTGWGRWSEERERPGIASSMEFYPIGIVPDGRLDARSVLVTNTPDISNAEFRPDVLEMNTVDGSFRLVEKNPGNVRSWGADWDGNIRFGLISDGVSSRLIYRAAPSQPWGPAVDFGRDTVSSEIAGLDADNRTLFVFKPSPDGRKALYAFDLQDRKFSGTLFQHKKYDVAAAVFSPKHRRLLGVRYNTEKPRQYWFAPDFTRLQDELDKANPSLVHEIVDMDLDVKKVLVFSHSAREPGYYTLINLETGKLLRVAKTRQWLKPEAMAEMYPVKCMARDGLELNGYVTLPLGRGKKNLPMVTFVHGGPFGPRDVWGFDPIVQFLANRGYAVLQVNYRGSGGYGDAFYLKGRQEVGGAIQDDIEDMTRWAVQQGVADPNRLAIMGASYGGYSALFALAHTPDLYRCGVACAAVSDWLTLLKSADQYAAYSRDALRFWAAVLGDMNDEKQRQRLIAASPVTLAAHVKAPLFIMHGEDDTTVPIGQAYEMAAALKKAGHAPETLYLDRVGHWWPANKRGVVFLERLEAFLAANLGK